MINDLDIVQWEYLLSPEFELINSAGKPLTGGWIEVYLHGTRDKYYCASDFDGTLHPFKIPLDSIGANVVLADPNNAYDVYVYNKFGSLIMSRYNVKCQGSGGSSTYVGDKLYYGQYRASNVTTIASLRRNKGNINLTNDGYLKLKSGMSYHITVRGSFTVDDPANEDTTLNYIEYTSVNPIKIDIDETKEGPQYFELSYDIYRLQEDMDYQVAFAQSNGMVTDLIVEVHSLSNLATSATGGDQEYEAGWGIDITNNVVSVDPSILEDYVYTAGDYISIDDNNVISVTGINPDDYATHDEVYEATVTAIELVTGLIPDAQVQSDWEEADTEDPAYIKNKPDLDIYATHDEVNTVSGELVNVVCAVSSVLQDEIDNIPPQVQSDWAQDDDTQVDYIKNKPTETELVAGQNIGLFAEGTTLTICASATDLSDYVTHDEVNNVSGQIIETVNNVSGVLHEEIIETAQTVSSLIPESEEVQFEEINLADYALASAIPDVSDFATHTEVYEAAVTSIQLVTGLIPEDTVTHTEVYEAVVTGVQLATSVIPDPLEAGEYVSIVNNVITVTGLQPEGDYATNSDVYDATVTAINIATGAIPDTEAVQFEEIDLNDYALASAIPDVSDFTTHDEVHESIVSALEYVTGIIPDAQVQSDWTEDDNTDPAYIKNKPDEYDLVAGQNIAIDVSGNNIVISSYASGGGAIYTAGDNIEIDNDVISVKDVILINARSESASGRSAFGNVTHWGNQDYGPGWWISAHTDNDKDYVAYNTSDIGQEEFFWGEYATDRANNGVSAVSQLSIHEGDITYKAGEFQDVSTLPIVWSCSKMAQDITNLQGAITAIPSTEYTAGTGIDITNDTISVDNTVAMKTDIPVVTGFATKTELATVEAEIPTLPSDEEVVFEELDLSDYALASAIPTIQLNGSDEVISINNYPIHSEGGGSTYTAGDHISIDNDEISVTGITELIAGNAITITTSGASAIISSTGEAQVQANWNETNTSSKAYIQNKPTIPAAQVQSNWNETNTSSKAYIQNKPTIHNYTGASGVAINNDTITLDNPVGLVAGDNITIEVSGVSAIISSTGGGGGSSYTAGNGIDITSDVISVDNTVAMKTDLPVISLNGSDQVTAIDGHTLAGGGGGGGTTYTAGDYIDITNDTISVTGLDNSNIFWCIRYSTTFAEAKAAYDAGKTLFVTYNGLVGTCMKASASEFGFIITKNFTTGSPEFERISLSDGYGWGYWQSVYPNVQADWNTTNSSAQSYINNKPDLSVYALASAIPAAPVQSNWNETDSSSLAYIQNKPTIPAAQVQANWNETSSSSMAYIKNKPNMSNYVTTTTHSDDVKYTFERYDSAGLGINAITAAAGIGKAKLRFQPGNLLTGYNLLSWSYCENLCYWGTNRNVVEFELGISMNNVIGTQWSEHNNVITLGNGNFIHQIYSLNGDAWTPTTIILKTYNNGTWVTSLTGILRDVRNSSTADNNTYLINVHGFIYLTSY